MKGAIERFIRSVLVARAAGVAAERLGKAIQRAVASMLCAILAGILLLAAFGCAIAALWLSLRPQIGPVLTPLAVGGLFLLLAIALLLISRAVARGAPKAPAVSTGDPLAELATDAVRLLREHQGAALLSAMLAGLILGRKR
jgi:hypothetical protein